MWLLLIGLLIGVGGCVYLYVRRRYAKRVLERGRMAAVFTAYDVADKIKDQAGRL
jgi:hypothetical protein